jgi:hypothetical protein
MSLTGWTGPGLEGRAVSSEMGHDPTEDAAGRGEKKTADQNKSEEGPRGGD